MSRPPPAAGGIIAPNGIALGGPNTYEARLGAELVARFPALDRLRTGTLSTAHASVWR